MFEVVPRIKGNLLQTLEWLSIYVTAVNGQALRALKSE